MLAGASKPGGSPQNALCSGGSLYQQADFLLPQPSPSYIKDHNTCPLVMMGTQLYKRGFGNSLAFTECDFSLA